MQFFLIGVTLDKARSTEVWDPDVKPDLNDSSHVFRGEHTLLVKQVYNLIFTILVPKYISYMLYMFPCILSRPF